MILSNYPRRTYLQGATPIEKMDRLSKYLNGPSIYIKRDDLTGLAFGGNKTRKLEFLIGDALAKNADTIITCGGVQSNHCRLTLAASIKEGLPCQIVLEERIPNSYDKYANGNNLLYNLLKPEKIHIAPYGKDPMEMMNTIMKKLRLEGRNPYIIPVGGSNSIGDLGYVACANEILKQMEQMKLNFDKIFITSGSGGSHAGLLVGMKVRNKNIPIYGIGINRPKSIQKKSVMKLAQDTMDKINVKGCIVEEDIIVYDDYIGKGYSIPTEEMKSAMRLVAEKEAIVLDPTYTGKTMAGLLDLIEKGIVTKNEKVLFIHTGGSPGLFAHPEIFK